MLTSVASRQEYPLSEQSEAGNKAGEAPLVASTAADSTAEMFGDKSVARGARGSGAERAYAAGAAVDWRSTA